MADVVEHYLLPGEQVEFSVRRHWAALCRPVTAYLGFLVGAFLVLWFLGSVELLRLFAVSFIMLSSLWILWIGADWYVERLVVTHKRVIRISGLLTRRVAIMPLAKVTDLTYEQTMPGRILGYGCFIVESAGQHQALSRLDYLAHADTRYQEISQLLFGSRANAGYEF